MGASEPTLPVETQFDVPAVMRDGTVLRADVYRPRDGGPYPSLLLRTPYGKQHYAELAAEADAMAAHGYIVALQDIRGRYASDGQFDPWWSPTRGDCCVLDGYDSVEWAAGLPNASGAVGTFGMSYMAWTQWKLAPTRPPHLRAMFVRGISADSRTTWPGIFTRDRQLQWLTYSLVPDTRRRLGLPGPQTVAEAQQVWNQVDRGKWLWFTPMKDFPAHILGGLKDTWEEWLSDHNSDWFGFGEICSKVDVPVYHVTSWYDRLWGSVDLYTGMVERGRSAATRANQKLLLGPWAHSIGFHRQVGDVDFGPQADLNSAEEMLRWFDYWLKGIDTGINTEPPVRLFVMGENRWRDEHEWPLARTLYTDFYCHSAGKANSAAGDGLLSSEPPREEPPDSYVYDPKDPVMSVQAANGHAAPGNVNSQDHRSDQLVYQTAPLPSDVEVTGPLVATLYAASSARDTDWAVRLSDVGPDGRAVNLSYGIVRARYRDSWQEPSLLEPDRVYEYTIRMVPTSNLFRRGHRIRLDIASSDFPAFDRNHNTGLEYWGDSSFVAARQLVFHDSRYPTRVVLPIIPRL
jgi:uncharacterized protein